MKVLYHKPDARGFCPICLMRHPCEVAEAEAELIDLAHDLAKIEDAWRDQDTDRVLAGLVGVFK